MHVNTPTNIENRRDLEVKLYNFSSQLLNMLYNTELLYIEFKLVDHLLTNR